MAAERPLSESEIRRLEELSEQLARDDPRFAQRLSLPGRRAAVTVVLALVGSVLFVEGLVVTSSSVLAGVCCAVVGLGVLAVSGGRAAQITRPRRWG